MDKPAQIVLQFRKNDGFWSALVEAADGRTAPETDQEVIAFVPVRSYSLEDHQFIQVRLGLKDGKEILAFIPRNIVKAIREGKSDLGISGFYSTRAKTK
jgi:hypothetical protein